MTATVPRPRNFEAHRVLVANRGEIADRILRTCSQLGLESVAVYSTEDRSHRYLGVADQSICLGPGRTAESYGSLDRVLSAAKATGATAIHPGYGFLSERPEAAEKAEELGLVWIGPTAETIRQSGDKAAARRLAADQQVPVIPGSARPQSDPGVLLHLAERLGYPLLVKANHGGGGRGLRIVSDRNDLERALDAAAGEAAAASGSPLVYLEKQLVRAHHLEAQLFGDGTGQVRLLGLRNCSAQRRHQKVIEESLPEEWHADQRAQLERSALTLGRALRLRSAATIEFLVDASAAPGAPAYFLEINPRLQVEHPVTEQTRGIDLVAWQLRQALDPEWRLEDQQLGPAQGHAIECRINAETAWTARPSPGRVDRVRWPSGAGIRVDSHLADGTWVSPHYDGLLAKLVVWASDRSAARRRMLQALEQVVVSGVATNVALLTSLLRDSTFRSGRYETRWLERLVTEQSPREVAAGRGPQMLSDLTSSHGS